MDGAHIICKQACHACDLLLDEVILPVNSKAVCPRCGHTVMVRRKHALDYIISLSISSIIFLIISMMYPFLTLNAQGHERTVTFLRSIEILWHDAEPLLSIMMLLVIIIVPLCFVLGLLYVLLPVRFFDKRPPYGRQVLRFTMMLGAWSMVDIFLIGIMVSMIKIMAFADIFFGASFWAYVLFTVTMAGVFAYVDKTEVWEQFERCQ